MADEAERAKRMKVHPYRIFIADAHPILRKGLAAALSGGGLQVVGEASSGPEAIEGVRRANPDLTILGLRLNGMPGLEVLKILKRELPGLHVYIYTADPCLEDLVRAADCGASGCLLKNAPEEVLLDQVRRILEGERIVTSEWRLAFFQEVLAKAAERSPVGTRHGLTVREVEILQTLARGLTTEQIAETLSLSVHTVRVHIRNILGKAGVSDRTQALAWAAKRKIVTFD